MSDNTTRLERLFGQIERVTYFSWFPSSVSVTRLCRYAMTMTVRFSVDISVIIGIDTEKQVVIAEIDDADIPYVFADIDELML